MVGKTRSTHRRQHAIGRSPARLAHRAESREGLAHPLIDSEGTELARVATAERSHLVVGQLEAAKRRLRIRLQLTAERGVADRALDDLIEVLTHLVLLFTAFMR